MNTNPDEVKLAMWLEDELSGEELAAFEASLEDAGSLMAKREEIRSWKAGLAGLLPADEEPPYPEFFNSRLAKELRAGDERRSAAVKTRGFSWQNWLMPLAACAGMVLAFWVGTKTGVEKDASAELGSDPAPGVVEPVVYTPEQGVSAEWIASEDAFATVVVLEGVEAIPDSIDFTETAAWREERESGSTAGMLEETEQGAKQ